MVSGYYLESAYRIIEWFELEGTL